AVTVAPAALRPITTARSFIGRTAPAEAVAVRARIAGELTRVTFLEGSEVAEGDLLYEIDRAPFEATVGAAEAALANAQARHGSAVRDLKRLRSLARDGVAARADLDRAESAEEETAAAVAQAEANLRTARIDLGYTSIRAAIPGRIGKTSVNRGNLVGPDSGVLTTINNLDPVYVFFSVGERDLLEVRRHALADGGSPRYVPRLVLPDGVDYPHEGRIDFIDNHVDETTGTVTIRAAFPNPERLLLPGNFVTVRVARGEPTEALLVPQAAIQQDQSGHFVLVVGDDNRVAARPVTLGDVHGTEWIVEKGLAAGERVIWEGVQKVRPDLVVNPTVAAPPMPVGN
ncbi:MAG: efflux RND transporter periplasmic adaptor subunit, partial [Myxococcales bacterium]|nr:efflux RND transporter periplasmic adaptor subunit [Myxococcales bacterium]